MCWPGRNPPARPAISAIIFSTECVAFGDMPNDLSVLAWAGTAYAMGNAHPLVKQACGNHAPPNTEDGVAQVLERLFRI